MRKRRRVLGEINIVPYIDVMLVLLVIFMITAPLLQEGVHVRLPHATAKPLAVHANLTPIVLTVDRVGHLFLNISAHPRRPAARRIIEALVAAVLRHAPETPVLVKADRRTPYGRVIQAMVLLQRSGAHGIGLMTRPRPARTRP
ncbi:MAG: ExbD/TolR family protein [Gammaproteobacteria bacterium]